MSEDLTAFRRLVEGITKVEELTTVVHRWLMRRGHHDRPVDAYLYHVVLEREGLADTYYTGTMPGNHRSRRAKGSASTWSVSVRAAKWFNSFHKAKRTAGHIIQYRTELAVQRPQMVPWRVAIRCYRTTPHMDVHVSGPNATVVTGDTDRETLLHVLRDKPK